MRTVRSALLLVFVLAAGSAAAQSGKIAGRVVDAATGQALPGVNVVIDGTLQGTATNLNGEFVIIGVRPGTYSIVASFIGYSVQRQEGVRVNLDLTTTVDFSLQEEVIQGEEIVVTAEAVAVRKDVTSSEARVTSETLDRLPVTELGQVLEVQAGITNRGGLHIRGGRSSEVMFMVDGVPVTDAYDGSTSVQLENDGIEELQVISGTFNAEYGNAMSGIVNVVTKEGSGDRFSGSAKVFAGTYAVTGSGGADMLRGQNADSLTVAGIQYRDIDPYSYLSFEPTHFKNAQVSLEGPILGDRITFFALGRYFSNDGWLYGARMYQPDGTAGDSSLVPMNNYERLSWQANVRLRLNRKMIVNLITLGQSSVQRHFSSYRRWAPDGRLLDYADGLDAKIKFTHLLSATTFYELNVATFRNKRRAHRYEDPFDARYTDFDLVPPDSVEVRPGEFEPVLTSGWRFGRGGTDLIRGTRETVSYLVKGDVSSQIGSNHLVKVGFQAKIDEMRLTGYQLQPAVDPETGVTIDPFRPAIPDSSSSRFAFFEDFSPISLSLYAQDKIEFESFIVNAGLRFDWFDSRASIPADPTDPNIYNPFRPTNRFNDLDGDGVISAEEETDDNRKTVAQREAYWWTDASAKAQLSPRLGVAYPVTDEGVIHFSYGIFFQIPTVSEMSEGFGFKIPNQSNTYGPYGNPDLDAQKTTMYEIGFKQGLGDFVVDVTGFYRDVRAWVSTSVPILTYLPGINYVVYTNRDYSNTRGLTLTVNRRFRDHFGFDVSYTYQVVEGSNSNPADEFFSLLGNNQPTLALLPLDWDQRHKLAGAMYVGADDWGGSLRFRLEDGFPYTPSFPSAAVVGNDVQPEFPRNSRRIPVSYELDLSLFYEFDAGRLRPRVFMDVYNLLDSRSVGAVFSDTGKPDVTLDQLRTGDFDPGWFVQPNFYSEPRRIHLGVELRF